MIAGSNPAGPTIEKTLTEGESFFSVESGEQFVSPVVTQNQLDGVRGFTSAIDGEKKSKVSNVHSTIKAKPIQIPAKMLREVKK